MEIVYLALILAFFFWIVQILLSFRRQADRIGEQIQQLRENQVEVLDQAERLEAAAREKTEQVEGLVARLDELSKKEGGLQREIATLEGEDGAKRPTRHKVEGSAETET